MRDRVLATGLLVAVWFLSGCGTNPTATLVLTPGPVRTATLALKTITPVLPPPTRASNVAEVTLRWDAGTNITDVDDVTELAVRLREKTGIMGAYGDEIQITVVYDPEQTTPEKIRGILKDLGFPAKLP